MKKIVLIIAIMIALMLLITGCGKNEVAKNSDGNKTNTEDVSNSKDTQNTEDKDSNSEVEDTNSVTFEALVLTKHDKSLAVFALKSNSFREFDPISVGYDTAQLDVAMGDIIEITFNGAVAESYPMQIGADNIVVKEKVKDNWPATSSIPEDYTSEEAIKDNYFVDVHGKLESKELMTNFIENTKMGIIGYVRKVSYTIEGDPIITDILFDGQKYYTFEDVSRDKFAGGDTKFYKNDINYVNTYETEDGKLVYLADKENITKEEYEENQNVTNPEEAFDVFPLFIQ